MKNTIWRVIKNGVAGGIIILGLIGCVKKNQTGLMKDADPSQSALAFYQCSNKEVNVSWIYDAAEEQKLIDYINKQPAALESSVEVNDLKGEMYGFTIGRKDGTEMKAAWRDGYWFAEDGQIFKVNLDFSEIQKKFSFMDQDVASLTSFPNLLLLAQRKGEWNSSLLKESNPLNPKGLQIAITKIKDNKLYVELSNTSKDDCMYGEYWSLQVKLDDTWYEIPTKEDWCFNDIANLLPSDGKTEKEYDLSLYGDLPKGTYRLLVEDATAEFEQ